MVVCGGQVDYQIDLFWYDPRGWRGQMLEFLLACLIGWALVEFVARVQKKASAQVAFVSKMPQTFPCPPLALKQAGRRVIGELVLLQYTAIHTQQIANVNSGQ